MCVCVIIHMCYVMHTVRLRGQLEVVISLLLCGPWGLNSGLSSQHFYLLSHLTDPRSVTLKPSIYLFPLNVCGSQN